MTNNQRFAAELVILGLIGVVLWARAEPRHDEQIAIPKIIQAQEFRLVDEKGKVYARLARNPAPFDRHGGEHGANAKRTLFMLNGDKPNSGSMVLVVDSNEEPWIDMQRLHMKEGLVDSSQHAVLSSNEDGTPTLELSSEAGKQTIIKP
ncbi:MAG TPA: hypothetical protein VKU00_25685 [Chthonomonadaceae bacterium]|nr:hypothetical protein [Chthonomonadaceae bacterium]